jgi:hypothetical protein
MLQTTDPNNNQNLNHNYALLANKSRMGRILGQKFNVNNLTINKIHNNKGSNLLESKSNYEIILI